MDSIAQTVKPSTGPVPNNQTNQTLINLVNALLTVIDQKTDDLGDLSSLLFEAKRNIAKATEDEVFDELVVAESLLKIGSSYLWGVKESLEHAATMAKEKLNKLNLEVK